MRFLSKFTSQDLLYIAIFSAMELAIKPIVTPLVHLVSAPLMIPGGSLAGGLYMMWLGLSIAIVKKPGTATIIGLVQAIVVLSLGYFGNHGAVSLISYTMPGVVADLIAIFIKRKSTVQAQALIITMANVTGTFIVTVLIMRLATIPLLIALSSSIISGIFGGILSYLLLKKLKKFNFV